MKKSNMTKAFDRKANMGLRAYATGGAVKGPGGSRDDAIDAKLSNGEYVLPADVVKKIGKQNLDELLEEHHSPHIDRDSDGELGESGAGDRLMNSLRHFADGGVVQQQPQSTYQTLANRGKVIDDAVNGSQASAPPPAPVAPAPVPAAPSAPVGEYDAAFKAKYNIGADGKVAPPPSFFQRAKAAVGLRDGGAVDDAWHYADGGMVDRARAAVGNFISGNSAAPAPAAAVAPSPTINGGATAGATTPPPTATAEVATPTSPLRAPPGPVTSAATRAGQAVAPYIPKSLGAPSLGGALTAAGAVAAPVGKYWDALDDPNIPSHIKAGMVADTAVRGAGAIVGGAAGATIGSAVPIAGTVAGALAGGYAGDRLGNAAGSVLRGGANMINGAFGGDPHYFKGIDETLQANGYNANPSVADMIHGNPKTEGQAASAASVAANPAPAAQAAPVAANPAPAPVAANPAPQFRAPAAGQPGGSLKVVNSRAADGSPLRTITGDSGRTAEEQGNDPLVQGSRAQRYMEARGRALDPTRHDFSADPAPINTAASDLRSQPDPSTWSGMFAESRNRRQGNVANALAESQRASMAADATQRSGQQLNYGSSVYGHQLTAQSARLSGRITQMQNDRTNTREDAKAQVELGITPPGGSPSGVPGGLRGAEAQRVQEKQDFDERQASAKEMPSRIASMLPPGADGKPDMGAAASYITALEGAHRDRTQQLQAHLKLHPEDAEAAQNLSNMNRKGLGAMPDSMVSQLVLRQRAQEISDANHSGINPWAGKTVGTTSGPSSLRRVPHILTPNMLVSPEGHEIRESDLRGGMFQPTNKKFDSLIKN